MSATSLAPMTAGRFNIVERATALPGACVFCTGSGGPFIDTGRFVRGHGMVLICVDCLTEMAKVAQITGGHEEKPDISLTPAEFEEVVSGHTRDLVNASRNLLDYLSGAGFVALLTESQGDSGGEGGSGEVATGITEQTDGTVSSEGPDGLSDDSGDGFPSIEDSFS